MLKRESGFTLVTTLLLTVSLLTAASGLLTLGTATNRRAVSEQDRAKAFYAAESGTNHALALLKEGIKLVISTAPAEGKIVPGTAPALTSPEGIPTTYRVWIFRKDPQDKVYHIVSEGKFRSAQRYVDITVSADAVNGQPVEVTWPTCEGATNKSAVTVKNNKTWPISQPGSICINGMLTLDQRATLDLTAVGTVMLYSKGMHINENARILIGPNTQVVFWVDGNTIIENNANVIKAGVQTNDPGTWPLFVVKGNLDIKNNSFSENRVLFLMDPSVNSTVVVWNNAQLYGGIWAPNQVVDMRNNSLIQGLVVSSDYPDGRPGDTIGSGDIPFPDGFVFNTDLEPYWLRAW